MCFDHIKHLLSLQLLPEFFPDPSPDFMFSVCSSLSSVRLASMCTGLGSCTRTWATLQEPHSLMEQILPTPGSLQLPKLFSWGGGWGFHVLLPIYGECWLLPSCDSHVHAATNSESLCVQQPWYNQKILFSSNPPLSLSLTIFVHPFLQCFLSHKRRIILRGDCLFFL